LKRTYRPKSNDPDVLIEMIGNSSAPTGRIFRKKFGDENISGKEIVQIRDQTTGILVDFVFSHLA
jgi:hypothetical protein